MSAFIGFTSGNSWHRARRLLTAKNDLIWTIRLVLAALFWNGAAKQKRTMALKDLRERYPNSQEFTFGDREALCDLLLELVRAGANERPAKLCRHFPKRACRCRSLGNMLPRGIGTERLHLLFKRQKFGSCRSRMWARFLLWMKVRMPTLKAGDRTIAPILRETVVSCLIWMSFASDLVWSTTSANGYKRLSRSRKSTSAVPSASDMPSAMSPFSGFASRYPNTGRDALRRLTGILYP